MIMKRNNLLFFVLISFLFTINACKKTEETPIDNPLQVKFVNDANSDFIINTIELRSRGEIGVENQEAGSWGNNLLTGGLSLHPGAYTNFSLNIPNLQWSEYRIGVINGNGESVMVLAYGDLGVQGALPISHWGSDNRTVSVAVKYDEATDRIYVSSWSDFATNL
jgi:hypothetical protein